MATYQVETTGGTYEVETADPTSAAESFGAGAVNNLPLGGQLGALGEEVTGKAPDYSSGMERWKKEISDSKANHPVAYGAGAVAGTAAPLAIPGVGEALEASPALTNAILGAGNALSDVDVVKNPGEAVKEGAIGAGIGAVTGKAMDLLPGKEEIANAAADTRVQGANLSPKLLGNMEPEELTEYGNFMKQHGLNTNDTQAALGNAEMAKATYGKQIHDIGADALPVSFSEDYTKPLLDKAAEIEKLDLPGAKQVAKYYRQGAQALDKNATTFGQLQKLKSYLGDEAFDMNHQVKNPAAADVWGQTKKLMEDTIDKSPAEYQQAMKNYKMAHDVTEGLTRKLGAERQGYVRNGIGFMGRVIGKMPGQSNPWINLPTAAAIGAFHPIWGLMGASPTFSNPAVKAGVMEGLSKAVPYEQAVANDLIQKFQRKARGQSDEPK